MSKVNQNEEDAQQARQQAHARAWALAKRQGVKPLCSIESLPRDPSPEVDSVDDFLSWVDATRRQDKDRSGLE